MLLGRSRLRRGAHPADARQWAHAGPSKPHQVKQLLTQRLVGIDSPSLQQAATLTLVGTQQIMREKSEIVDQK
jgi:hypothetical protein